MESVTGGQLWVEPEECPGHKWEPYLPGWEFTTRPIEWPEDKLEALRGLAIPPVQPILVREDHCEWCEAVTVESDPPMRWTRG